jgi:hypothetical protein
MNTSFRLLVGLLAVGVCAQAASFTVAPGGKDASATLEAARDTARKAGAGPHRIVVQPGDYFLTKTLELDARDNGLTIEAVKPGTAILYGGTPVTGWRRDGEKFWCADVAGVKEGTVDFRALVVNGRLPSRARLPESGTFIHKSVFNVRWLSLVGGGWERKPTNEELTTMLYDPKDVPATLEAKNAEVRVYHMWDESLVGVAGNDTQTHRLTFAQPAAHPAGAFGVKKYAIFNTREGMTQPGQWYLDRAAGRVVYWPLDGEDMSKALVVAPRLERIIRIAGAAKAPVEKITVRGLGLQATTTPLKSGGFGAYVFEGALRLERARQCMLEKLEICNVGGQGLVVTQVQDCRISGSQIHDTGACGLKADGTATDIADNHIHHVGRYYPSAVALSVSTHAWRTPGTKGFSVLRNEVHDTPYSGMIGSGGNHLFEGNVISRVMRELHDGGAIYGGMSGCILRSNIVRDVVKIGEGYGVSSYYLDEGAQDCLVEGNISIGVERPVHNHIARNLVIRDNIFYAATNMVLSFQRSANCVFSNNTLYVPGQLSLTPPSAVRTWAGNAIISHAPPASGAVAVAGRDDAKPAAPKPERKASVLTALRLAQPPKLDGEIGGDEWPGRNQGLDREPSRDPGSGAPVFVKVAYDDANLYVALTVALFEAEKLRTGAVVGQDDGAELCLAGKTPDGKPATFVVRGFAGGAVQSVTEGGATAADAARLGQAVQFAAKKFGKQHGGWRSEWVLPWSALGLKPAAGQKIACNLAVYRSEAGSWRCLEGTLAENWRVDQAGWLQLK